MTNEELLSEVKKDHADLLRQIQVVIESDVMPKLELFAEGQQTILETLAPKSRVAELEEEISFLKSVVRLHSEEIARLKKAQ